MIDLSRGSIFPLLLSLSAAFFPPPRRASDNFPSKSFTSDPIDSDLARNSGADVDRSEGKMSALAEVL